MSQRDSRSRTWIRFTFAAALVGLLGSGRASAQGEPATLFGKKCAACHTVGEGDRVGPDLMGVTSRRDRQWLEGFIRTPGRYFDSGDQVATDLLAKYNGIRMPDQELTDDELSGLIDYFADCEKAGSCKADTGKVKAASTATPSEIRAGREYFDGTRVLAGGGPPCISCHNTREVGVMGGGTLAADLTFVYARLGDQGLSSALASTPFPLMKNIYKDAPLQDDEAFKIKAYLWSLQRDGTPPRSDNNFVYAGVLGLFLSLGLIGMIWAGRMRGVRQNIVKRGHR